MSAPNLTAFEQIAALTESTRRRMAGMASPFTSGGTAPGGSHPGASFASPQPLAVQFGAVPGGEVGRSGEYRGPPLLSGGGVGDLVLFELSPILKSSICLGALSGGLKFCTLGASGCSYSSHIKKASVEANRLYISTGRNSAFINHYVDVSLLTAMQKEAMLAERHTKEEWVQVFHAWNMAQKEPGPEVSSATSAYTRVGEFMLSAAITPARNKRRQPFHLIGDDGDKSIPDLVAASSSMTDSDESTFDLVTIHSEEIKSGEDRLSDVLDKWETVVGNVNKVSGLFKKMRTTFGGDIDSLTHRVSTVDAKIGEIPAVSAFEECTTVWDGLTVLLSQANDFPQMVEQAQQNFGTMVDSKLKGQGSYGAKIEELNKGVNYLSELMGVMNEEQEAIVKHMSNGGMTAGVATTTLQDELRQVADRVIRVESHLNAARMDDLSGGLGPVLSKEINTLKTKISLLEARIPQDSIMSLGGHIFQSREDVMIFVEKNVPSCHFHLFHDGVTLLESLTSSFNLRTEVMSEWYQAEKVGVTTQQARHMASFRTTLPHVFGHTKDTGVGTKHPLPALKTFSDWDPYNQEGGVKNYITSGMEDLRLQIPTDIANELPGDEYAVARNLAMDMHSQSQVFVFQLSGFINMFYNEMSANPGTTAEEAHEITAAIVKKVFEELKRVRSSAGNASSDPNKLSRCSTYLWCMIQAHRVQKAFLDARFRNHPAIAPVIILHVFRTRITSVAFHEEIKRLTGRIATLENPKKQQKIEGAAKHEPKKNQGGPKEN